MGKNKNTYKGNLVGSWRDELSRSNFFSSELSTVSSSRQHLTAGKSFSVDLLVIYHDIRRDVRMYLLFSRKAKSDSLRSHGLQHTRLPCASLTFRACSHSVHWVSDAVQPSHPLSPTPLLLLLLIFPSIIGLTKLCYKHFRILCK